MTEEEINFADEIDGILKKYLMTLDPFTMITTFANAAGMVGAACDVAYHTIRPIVRDAAQVGFDITKKDLR